MVDGGLGEVYRVLTERADSPVPGEHEDFGDRLQAGQASLVEDALELRETVARAVLMAETALNAPHQPFGVDLHPI